MPTKVALVTGASRGIGKGSAVALAKAGFDVAIAARTMHEGEGRNYGGVEGPIPGSLESTAAAIEAAGQRVLPVPMDLLDQASWPATVETVIAEWSRIDVLVNNARHQSADHKARFFDVSVETLERELDANLLAPVVLAKLVLPGMVARGSGTIINLSSTAGYMGPPGTAERGGWSTSYALAKGGLHRLAAMIALELGDKGINAFNLNPGFVITERNASRIRELGMDRYVGAPPAALGTVVAWLATQPEASSFNGKTIEGQPFALEHNLFPDWRPEGSEIGSVGPQESVW